MLWGGDTKKMKINSLEKLVNEVRQTPNQSELIQLIDKTITNKQLATARTKTALEGIRVGSGQVAASHIKPS